MPSPRLSNALLDETGLRKALNDHAASLTTIYLESETRVVFTALADYLGPKITLPPVRWRMGRAFGPTIEIRWHLGNEPGSQGDQFQATCMTETNVGPSNWQPSAWNALLDAETHSRDVLLRGVNSIALPKDHLSFNVQPQGGLWIDIRVPRPLRYPTTSLTAPRLVLKCIDYYSQGLVVLTRLCELTGLQDFQR